MKSTVVSIILSMGLLMRCSLCGDGIEAPVLPPQQSYDCNIDSSQEREMEFDRILDAMVQDGTIQVKPVSPFMAKLRTIGSTLFVKYLAAKNVLRRWWKLLWHAQTKKHNSIKRTA